jgi:hypothetical protein
MGEEEGEPDVVDQVREELVGSRGNNGGSPGWESAQVEDGDWGEAEANDIDKQISVWVAAGVKSQGSPKGMKLGLSGVKFSNNFVDLWCDERCGAERDLARGDARSLAVEADSGEGRRTSKR